MSKIALYKISRICTLLKTGWKALKNSHFIDIAKERYSQNSRFIDIANENT
jgi:hypothetical protein